MMTMGQGKAPVVQQGHQNVQSVQRLAPRIDHRKETLRMISLNYDWKNNAFNKLRTKKQRTKKGSQNSLEGFTQEHKSLIQPTNDLAHEQT